MRRVMLWLALPALGGGAFFALALQREAIEPWLVAIGVEADSALFKSALKLVGIVLIGAPLTVALWSIVALGSDRAAIDRRGFTVLKLRAGARYFLTLATAALAFLMLYVAQSDEGAHIAFRLGLGGFGVAFMLMGLWIWIARVRYNHVDVFVTDYLGVERRYAWADLVDIESNDEVKEFWLRFEDGRRARISYFYAGLGDLIDEARRRLFSGG